MSYKNPEIWRLANELVLEIHAMTLNDLPKFEMFAKSEKRKAKNEKLISSSSISNY